MENLIKITDLSFGYDQKLLIHHLNFSCNNDDFIGITGENGSGKSTLLKLITGVIKAPKGSISYKKNLRISYVDQITLNSDSTFPSSVKEILEMAIPNNFWGIFTKNRNEKIKTTVDYLKISDLLNKKMQELSGGQQQKVRLARALLNKPELLILDEPTTGIDIKSQKEFLEKIKEIHANGTAIIMISHRKEDLNVCHKLFVLNDEHLEEQNV